MRVLARQRLANDRRQAEELHAKRERKKQVYKAHVSRRLANPAEEQRLAAYKTRRQEAKARKESVRAARLRLSSPPAVSLPKHPENVPKL